MEKLVSRSKKQTSVYEDVVTQEGSMARALRRSREARDHLQDLLERSDQKAGFVVTGIAFLGIFVQQGGYNAGLTTAALVCYGLAFICVCITAFPRQWRWYFKRSAHDLASEHLQETLQEELDRHCRQEADLRRFYQFKNIMLLVGFLCLMAGMAITQIAVVTR